VHAAGGDLRTWPDPATPALQFVQLPEGNGTRLLRPAYVLALVHGPDPGAEAVRRLRGTFDGRQFMDAGMVNDDVWALRALRAWGVPPSDPMAGSAAAAVVAAQQPDGGWGWRTTGPSSVDMTGMALVALREAELLPADVAGRAADYIVRAQRDGGFGEHVGDRANCNSTVWGIRGLAAAGREAPDAWGFLARLRDAEGGYSPEPGWHPNIFCTAEATALQGDGDAGRVPRGGGSRDAGDAAWMPAAALAAALAVALAGRRGRGRGA
jgi:hypothetical protein